MNSETNSSTVKVMTQLTVYYDELCILCSNEMKHYKKQIGSEKILFVDINSPAFDPKKDGLDPFQVHKVMHVKKNNGEILTRVNAFMAIWEILPRYHWLHRMAKIKLIKKIMDIGYVGFATLRPFLPKRKDLCADSPYCDTKPSQPKK